MTGIVFATHLEARPFLEKIHAVHVAQAPFDLFRAEDAHFFDGSVAVSGMGKVAAAMAAMHLVLTGNVTTLISAGLCGWLGEASCRRTGDLFRVSTAVEGDCDRFGHGELPVACDASWFSTLPEGRLITCDKPVFDADRRSRLSALGELADMEGAAVSRVAARYHCTCAMIKGISDNADENGREAVSQNIRKVSGLIADRLIQELIRGPSLCL
ncbi:hypothetical protein LJC71_05245 [Desulfosarcina sp. OttesenSCG-928-A07]|nr:hypothetical protein [Desulfosarcina sp. OttesenSCG-928-G17]MDL2329142.1 hypothetical protein [Desulfosarcina sp. OttesenSCG-928-A07]